MWLADTNDSRWQVMLEQLKGLEVVGKAMQMFCSIMEELEELDATRRKGNTGRVRTRIVIGITNTSWAPALGLKLGRHVPI